ncbi:hypothetical protein ACNO8X_26100 [Mycobacterium sp. PDNC021]|uniref:hypothetical protein n=1 Tax=Mycobacterium sp. PDNC021 TaxID=3391399 RepID=UPI003AAB5D44
MTEDEFWSATDQLKLIHQWARARYVAPWALLLAVLLRVAVSSSPRVMLPGPPAPASLNMAVVLVGRSGAGKGVTDKLARIVWPGKDIHEEGLGSGQGIHELFKETKDPADRITSALFNVSEIDHMAALHAGQANNTRATIKAALTGDRLGSKGATSATTRAVPADSYRLGLSIMAQYGHTGVLLDDVSGGTPQRMVWGSVTDPTIPDTPGPEPGRVLDSNLPPWATADKLVLIQYGTPEITNYVAAGLLANQRGELDAIDGHRTLTRLKVAAQLAIMDHRMVISELDWKLSEHIMLHSDATREAVLEYDRQAARSRVRERAIARAVGEDFYDASRLETVKSSLLRMLERDGEQSAGDLRRRLGKREKRELFDQAIALLESAKLVSARAGEHNSMKYRIGSPVTNEVTPENPSSEGVTTAVTRDRPATITDLDSRRSDESRPQDAGEWLVGWMATNAGPGVWVKPSTIFAAGQKEGYEKYALVKAKQMYVTTPIESSGNGRNSMWRIAPTAATEDVS